MKTSEETVRRVLLVLANCAGYGDSMKIVVNYLAGKPVTTEIGRHGVWHFDEMMRVLGRELPKGV